MLNGEINISQCLWATLKLKTAFKKKKTSFSFSLFSSLFVLLAVKWVRWDQNVCVKNKK